MKKRKGTLVFPSSLQPFLQSVEMAHQLCQEVRLTSLHQLNKENAECVTLADYGVQVILNKLLHNTTPEINIIAEENSKDFFRITSTEQQNFIVELTNHILGDTMTLEEFGNWLDFGQDELQGIRSWVIDPIDGTQEFINSNRYVIGIGVLDNNTPTFAFLSSFSPDSGKGKYYYTWEHRAYCYDPNIERIQIIQVSDRLHNTARPFCNVDALSQVHDISFVEDDVYSTLSAYIAIASGLSDLLISSAFKNTSKKIWDHVAGIALLQKAGGIVSDIDGQDLNFSEGRTLSKNKGLILSNGRFHKKLISN